MMQESMKVATHENDQGIIMKAMKQVSAVALAAIAAELLFFSTARAIDIRIPDECKDELLLRKPVLADSFRVKDSVRIEEIPLQVASADVVAEGVVQGRPR